MDLKTANRLQQLRKESGYSQDALAEKLGLSRQAISSGSVASPHRIQTI